MKTAPDPRVVLLRAAARTTGAAADEAAARGGGDASTRGGARANASAGLTLDDLILRRAVGGGEGGGGTREGGSKGASRGAAANGDAAASGMVFSRARAPTVVTGWENPHERRDETARAGDGRRARVDEKTREYAENRRLARHPTELAGTRNAVGVVRETVDYNAGYLSPNEVNADLDGPPSPVRGFAQRLMSLEASPTPRGKHSRKRSKTQKSAEPEDAYALEEKRKRARARASATEAEALIAAARRMPASPGSDAGGPGSASRSGRALRAPGAFWASSSDAANGRREQSEPAKRGPGRPPKNAKQYTPPTSEDEYEAFGEDEDEDGGDYRRGNANAQRAMDRIRQGARPVGRPRGGNAQRASGSRKGKPGPKPGAAAAKKAAMIAAGIPIPVLPPGVKRGRGRPPKSMLVIPDGPPNLHLSDYVRRSIAKIDPDTAERVKPNRASDREYDDKPNKLRIRSPKYDHIHVEEEKTACVACGRVDGEDRMLLCDGCDRGYHTHCLVPRLDKVPENEWFCYECVSHNRPKTAAAEAFELRKAAKAHKPTYEAYDEREEYDEDGQRLSVKLKLNGERKRKPGPKPGSRNKLIRRHSDGSRDQCARGSIDDPDTIEKRPVGRPRKDPNAWSDEQLEALQNAQVRVDLGRKNFWTEVASYVPGKSARECQAKVYAGLNLGDIDGDEGPAEDAKAEDAEDDEDDDLSDDDRAYFRERTLRTPTKPNSS